MLLTFFSGTAFCAIGDFDLTDTDGESHQLYQYLQDDEVVVLKFFFLSCDNCQGFAPRFESLYQQFGSNQEKVTFLSMEVFGSSDSEIDNWKTQHGSSVPALGGSNLSYWSNNIEPILGNGFTQVLVLKGNPQNPGDAEILYSNFGWISTSETENIASIIEANLSSSTGIEEADAKTFSIGPNPSQDYLDITAADLPSGKYYIQIFNNAGVLVEELNWESSQVAQKRLDLSRFAAGSYLLSISDSAKRWTKAFVKH